MTQPRFFSRAVHYAGGPCDLIQFMSSRKAVIDPTIDSFAFDKTFGKDVVIKDYTQRSHGDTWTSFNLKFDIPDGTLIEHYYKVCPEFSTHSVFVVYRKDGKVLCKPGCMAIEPITATIKRLEEFADSGLIYLGKNFKCAADSAMHGPKTQYWLGVLRNCAEYEWSDK